VGGKQMKFWKPLQKHDLIDIVAPGFACSDDELERGVRLLESWGFRARIPRGLFSKDILCASPDALRFHQLKNALLATDSQAVWCLRGGYGSIRLVPQLVRLSRRLQANAKIFIGLSDITTLHLFLNQKVGWATLHGSMLDRLARPDAPRGPLLELKRVLMGEKDQVEFTRLQPLNSLARKNRKVAGAITGGNLITLQSSLSTSLHWRPRGQIVFLEDIGERAYRVDRVLEHFRQAGVWSGVRAVVFGDFTGGRDPDGRDRVPLVLKRFAEEFHAPVFAGVRSGHGRIQRVVPFGAKAVLECGEKGHVKISSGAQL